MNFTKNYLESAQKQFEYYKILGDKTFEQLDEKSIFWLATKDSNSIAIIVKHMVGNMHSRWTHFLTEDGEKPGRNRDQEFENNYQNKDEMIAAWNNGWQCLFDAIDTISEDNFNTIIYIRNQGHSITEAINRQLCHYSYHVGQLVFLGKTIQKDHWKTLSIAKSTSKKYNQEKFSKEKERKHFTEDL